MTVTRRVASLAFLLCNLTIWVSSVACGAPPVAALEELQKSVDGYLRANNRDAAAEVATKIINACAIVKGNDASDLQFAKNDPKRIGFLLFAARLDVGLGNVVRGQETFRSIVNDSDIGSIDRLHAEAFLLKFKIDRREDFLADAISLLAQSSLLVGEQRGFRDECQNLVIDGIVSVISSEEIEYSLLMARLDAIEKQMIDANVPFGVARLTRFAKAIYLARNDRTELLADSLSELENIIGEQEVTAYRRAQYWNLLAGLRLQRRHFADAFDACREFELNARRAGPTHIYEAAIARDQSSLVALLIGDYAEARKSLESTRPIHTSKTPANSEHERLMRLENATTWRVNLAKSMEGDNEFLPARRLLEEAVSTLANDRQSLPKLAALVDNNLALNHYLTGDFDIAAVLIKQVKETIRPLSGEDERLGNAFVNEGWIALGKGNLAAAADSFANAADHFATHLSRSHPRYAEALTYQARIAVMQEDLPVARRWIDQAEGFVYERICRDLAASQSTRDRMAILQESRVHPESIAWPGTVDTYFELAPKLGIPAAEQYDVALKWKDLLRRFDQSSREAISPFKADESAVQAKLREAYFRKVSLLKRRELQQEIDLLETQLRRIQRAKQAPLISDINVAPSHLKDVVARLKDTDLFLDVLQIRTFQPPSANAMVGSKSQYIGFVVRADGHVDRLALGTTNELDAAIVRWTQTITERRKQMSSDELDAHRARLDEAARQVARSVQQPLLEIDASFQRLLVRPDAMTHLIPWAALPGTGGKRFWIENIGVQVCNGAGVDDSAVKPLPPKSLLAAGGIDFGDLKSYQPLPGSLMEKDRVVERFHSQFADASASDLQGRNATEAALLQRMPKAEYIHLATHGFYHRKDEFDVFGVTGATTLLQTGLVVAPPLQDEIGHDQYLTAAEIGELNLSQTSLVMLSACESSLGQSLAGQGVQGMLGSFHSAGARHVIGTLWIVDDAATVSMVDRFYQQLWNQSLTPVDALRAAQLEMIRTTDTDVNVKLFSHPYAWAAFVCSEK